MRRERVFGVFALSDFKEITKMTPPWPIYLDDNLYSWLNWFKSEKWARNCNKKPHKKFVDYRWCQFGYSIYSITCYQCPYE